MTVKELIEKLKDMPQDYKVLNWLDKFEVADVSVDEDFNKNNGDKYVLIY